MHIVAPRYIKRFALPPQQVRNASRFTLLNVRRASRLPPPEYCVIKQLFGMRRDICCFVY